MNCNVCEEAKSKYKCPACLIPYCSLKCFRKHKGYPAWIECTRPNQETPCDKPVPVSETETRTIIPPIDVDRPCYIDVAEDVLSQSKLECIASSTEIRDALKNEELQKLIRNIDCSANTETELEKAMEQDVFRLFTEKILATVNQSGNQ
ncbi:Zinc finger, HIT-type [Artemisia annua]|uniref:Zinc finger, HIT-type n=1 Tax=Artemisia annua TaxID=35608 RepID=A0A2U1KRI5_ARTAN|nr:Zinc finger, HIT-type [Artemisia annua]